MTDDEQKKIARKIHSTVYRQMHQQLLFDFVRTKCDIECILQLFEKIDEFVYISKY